MDTAASSDALRDIDKRICAEELKALRKYGLPQQYLIISPVNLANPPAREIMEQVTSAIRALADAGLLVIPSTQDPQRTKA
jgi:hypothetical protein